MTRHAPATLARTDSSASDLAALAARAGVAAGFVGLAVLLIAASLTWPLDHDEHQFIVPAMLLWEGELPYRDYPHLHMPWQVFIYAAVLPMHDNPFLVTRLLNAGAVWATLLLVYLWGRRWLVGSVGRDAAKLLALTFVVLLAFVDIVPYTASRSWNHALSGLPAMAGVLLLIEGTRRERLALLLAAGLCAGLAVGVRLSWAPMLGAFGLGLLMLHTAGFDWRRWLTRIGAFGAGLGVAMLPVAYVAAQAPDAFVFGTVGYHRLSHLYHLEQGNWTGWPARIRAITRLPFEHPAFVLNGLVLVTLIGLTWRRWRSIAMRERRVLAFVLLALGFAMLGAYSPSRVNPQYHYGALLFVVLSALVWLRPMVATPRAGWRTLAVLGPVAATVAMFGLSSYVLSFRSLAPAQWTPTRAAEVREAVAEHVGEGELVWTLAPAFVLMAGAEVERSLANGPFTFRVAHLMEPGERASLGVVGLGELDARHNDAPPAAVLTGFERDGTDEALATWAKQHGYKTVDLERSFEMRHQLWLRPGSPPAASSRGAIKSAKKRRISGVR